MTEHGWVIFVNIYKVNMVTAYDTLTGIRLWRSRLIGIAKDEFISSVLGELKPLGSRGYVQFRRDEVEYDCDEVSSVAEGLGKEYRASKYPI